MKTGVLSLVRVCVMLALLLTLALSGIPPAAAQARSDVAAPAPSDPTAALIFIENAGQFPEGARFQVRGAPQGTVWLAENAIWLTIVEPAADEDARSSLGPEPAKPDPVDQPRQAAAIKLSFVGANPHPRLEPFNRLQTHVSFFIGSDPTKWRADVPAWGGVRYVELYPGINLELVGEQGRLVPRLVARHGADLGAVRLRVEGADAVAVEGDALRLTTAASEATWPLLRAEGSNAAATVRPLGGLAFEMITPFAHAQYSRQSEIGNSRSQIQNPQSTTDLLYSTFLGGSGDDADQGSAITVDGGGATYVTGWTRSADFPTTLGAFDTTYSEDDIFVAKLNAAGSALDYATLLGGTQHEYGNGIAVDGSGAAYVTGLTYSADFPTTPGALDTSYTGSGEAFVAKLNATGSALDYATFLGGSDDDADEGLAISVSGSGVAYVTGRTGSSDFPTTPGAFDTSFSGGYFGFDAFVAKLNAAGSVLGYATFLGGSEDDGGFGIAVDGSAAAYVTGRTGSSDFPTTPGAFDISCSGCGYYYGDAFVAKLNAAGSALLYSTFLGGSDGDIVTDIAADGSGAAYVSGATYSSDFPTTPGAFDMAYNGDSDGFVAKLNAAGSGLDYATFLGGSSEDRGNGIAVDGSGVAYVTGGTLSSDFPTTCGAFDRSYNGGGPFVVRLNAAGSALDYGTYLGSSRNVYYGGISLDGSGAAYITGVTWSSDFPTTPGAFDTTHNGGADAFVAKLAMEPTICFYIYLPLVLRNR